MEIVILLLNVTIVLYQEYKQVMELVNNVIQNTDLLNIMMVVIHVSKFMDLHAVKKKF